MNDETINSRIFEDLRTNPIIIEYLSFYILPSQMFLQTVILEKYPAPPGVKLYNDNVSILFTCLW